MFRTAYESCGYKSECKVDIVRLHPVSSNSELSVGYGSESETLTNYDIESRKWNCFSYFKYRMRLFEPRPAPGCPSSPASPPTTIPCPTMETRKLNRKNLGQSKFCKKKCKQYKFCFCFFKFFIIYFNMHTLKNGFIQYLPKTGHCHF